MSVLLKPLAIAAVSVATGALLWVATGIARDDIAAFEGSYRDAVSNHSVINAGDVMAVSANGQSSRHVCSFSLSPEGEERLDRRYFNALSRHVVGAEFASISFAGVRRSLRNEDMRSFSESCDPCRDLIDAVNQRERLCLVDRVLAERADDGDLIPFAARFRAEAFVLTEAFFDHCKREFSSAAAAVAADKPACPLAQNHTVPTGIRAALGVIDDTPVELAQARN